MPSDLPLMSTGRAMYPVPPQRGQFFGSTDPPQLVMSFSSIRVGHATKLVLLRNPNRVQTAPADCARVRAILWQGNRLLAGDRLDANGVK
jgi:hypothetical protein